MKLFSHRFFPGVDDIMRHIIRRFLCFLCLTPLLGDNSKPFLDRVDFSDERFMFCAIGGVGSHTLRVFRLPLRFPLTKRLFALRIYELASFVFRTRPFDYFMQTAWIIFTLNGLVIRN